jgi:hypothetical protein
MKLVNESTIPTLTADEIYTRRLEAITFRAYTRMLTAKSSRMRNHFMLRHYKLIRHIDETAFECRYAKSK